MCGNLRNNIYCLMCNVQFSHSDVEVMEPEELPLCDECAYSLYYIRVQYDGSMDLLEFLKSNIREQRCMNCLNYALKLEHIKYGTQVDAAVRCSKCHVENLVEIHIEFV